MKSTNTIRRNKKLSLLLLLLFIGTYVGAQTTLDTVFIVNKARKFNPGKHILLMFEVVVMPELVPKLRVFPVPFSALGVRI